jgi:hypothetical protein
MFLKELTQNGQQIQGSFGVGQPLKGDGPFTGTVKSNATIQFTVHSSDQSVRAPLFFSGQIQQDGSISGQYCSLDTTGQCNPDAGGFGSWFVQASNSGS